MLYPLLMKPTYRDYLWGGREIVTKYERQAPALKRYAESWEVSDRSGRESSVENGELSSKTLFDIAQSFPFELYGTRTPPQQFPLLLKLIDAYQNLSVQVHPKNETAHVLGGEPKSECWYVLDAKENAKIYAGLKKPLTKAQFMNLAGKKEILNAMHSFTPKQGELFYIPAGSLHAIGEGILLLEIQQNSDTTFRVYDWDRFQDDGTPRALHIDSAKEAVNLLDVSSPLLTPLEMNSQEGVEIKRLVEAPFFSLAHMSAEQDIRLNKTQPGCEIFFVEEGTGLLRFEKHILELAPGMTILVPHICKSMTLETAHIDLLVIRPKLL